METMLKREELLKKMTMIDFMALDLQLYLNTNPDDCDALQMYNSYLTDSNEIKKEYEANFGPLTSFRTKGKDGWQWSDCPWPWQADANFSLLT